MQAVSYLKIIEEQESRRGFSGVREDESLYGTEGQLYEDLLEHLRKEFLQDKYSLCLQVRGKDDEVVYEFPRIACPELFLQETPPRLDLVDRRDSKFTPPKLK